MSSDGPGNPGGQPDKPDSSVEDEGAAESRRPEFSCWQRARIWHDRFLPIARIFQMGAVFVLLPMALFAALSTPETWVEIHSRTRIIGFEIDAAIPGSNPAMVLEDLPVQWFRISGLARPADDPEDAPSPFPPRRFEPNQAVLMALRIPRGEVELWARDGWELKLRCSGCEGAKVKVSCPDEDDWRICDGGPGVVLYSGEGPFEIVVRLVEPEAEIVIEPLGDLSSPQFLPSETVAHGGSAPFHVRRGPPPVTMLRGAPIVRRVSFVDAVSPAGLLQNGLSSARVAFPNGEAPDRFVSGSSFIEFGESVFEFRSIGLWGNELIVTLAGSTDNLSAGASQATARSLLPSLLRKAFAREEVRWSLIAIGGAIIALRLNSGGKLDGESEAADDRS